MPQYPLRVNYFRGHSLKKLLLSLNQCLNIAKFSESLRLLALKQQVYCFSLKL